MSQCSYCQGGKIMAVAALLAQTPHPSDAVVTNLCRCGTQQRVRRAYPCGGRFWLAC